MSVKHPRRLVCRDCHVVDLISLIGCGLGSLAG